MSKPSFILAIILAGGLTSGCHTKKPGPPPLTLKEPPLPANAIVVPSLPPPRQFEKMTTAPGLALLWIPGEWDWDGSQWEWSMGRWEHPPKPGQVWIPAQSFIHGSQFYYSPGGWH